MDEQGLEYMQQMQMQLNQAKLGMDSSNLSKMQQDMFIENQEKSMIKEQLDLNDIILRMDYLLRGYYMGPDDNGEITWKKPQSEDMKVLSDYGVQMIMNTVSAYLNQNTLLSNFKDEQIAQKMKNFADELTYAIFLNYEKIFLYPSIEKCLEEIKERVKKQAMITKASYEIQNNTDKTFDEIYAEKLKLIEKTIETEVIKTRDRLMAEKLKRLPLLKRMIIDAVHTTYNRSWNGQERSSLRQHMNINEARGFGVSPMMPKKGGLFSSWGKR